MKPIFTNRINYPKQLMTLLTGFFLFAVSSTVTAQLGVYSFTGFGVCPHQNPAVTTQPANATFSNYVFAGGISCKARTNEFETQDWANGTNTVNSSEYFGFTVTPSAGYNLTLTQLSLNQRYDRDPASGVTKWVLRSSLDNFTSNIAVDTVTLIMQTDVINLPAGSFTNIGAVTFRFYLLNVNTTLLVNWRNDEVTLNGTVNVGPPSQLGLYPFTGSGACPNQNPSVTAQPANAVFSDYNTVNTSCKGTSNVFETQGWNTSAILDITQYNEFTITPNGGFTLTLSSISFTEYMDQNPSGTTNWYLRSSLDGYTTNLATGTATGSSQTPTITLPVANFTNIGAVTFRLYMTNVESNGRSWTNDEVTITGTVNGSVPANPANPTSNSPQCATPGVTMNFTGTAPAGETWYWQSSATGTSTTNSASSYTVNTAGTYYVRSRDNTTFAWSSGAGSVTVAITPVVGTPVFALGATSTRCQAAGSVTYTATAANATNITYSVDATTLGSAGNSFDASTGTITYGATWSGISTVTATATGCNGPTTAIHSITTTATVATPVFTSGTTSTRCQAAGSVTYAANPSAGSTFAYSVDATTSAFPGNGFNPATGAVTYAAGWSGTTTVSVYANGCNGPSATVTHTITTNGTIGTPVFALGATSTRCQGPGVVTYQATAANAISAITYSLSAAGGSTINTANGDVTWVAGFTGSATITATATGCGGPKTATHIVSVTATVGTPVFTSGATSTRCQAAGSVTYAANPSAGSTFLYSVDGTTSGFAGNSFNTTTGALTYAAGWSGISTISVYANGCNGPSATVTHTVTTNATIGTPVFTTMGATSTRCQGAAVVTYQATAANAINPVTYSLSGGGGSTINTSTGDVTWAAGFSGSATITATATGCGGPKTATHTVTGIATVGTPAFTLGATSTRCQGAGTVTYTATATANSGITYDLDNPSKLAGNNIDVNTGTVTYVAGWADTSYITVTAVGCNGPKTAIHRAVSTLSVGTPSFTLGATSTRCQGGGTITYTATASNASGITYSIDASSNVLNSINSSGVVTYSPLWFGITTITATANGCNGPTTATHIVSVTASVTTPVFAAGSTSTRCQGAGTVTYNASSNNTSGITYSLSGGGGSTINAGTGEVTWVAGFSGTATITASAAGCNGPKTATHTVSVTATVGTPSFTMGATSTRCQGAGTVTYTATASGIPTFVYSVDATTSGFAGNSFNTTSGALTYAAGWSGPSTISVYANGCNGPSATVTHTVTTTPTVTTPVFDSGATSIRCQGAGSVLYGATNNNNAGITYSLSGGGGSTIVSGTGMVTWAAGFSGSATITANAAGCNGPKTATHIVTVTPTVGNPTFSAGTTTTRCQGAGTVTYMANATNKTSITYSLDATTASFPGNSFNTATGELVYDAAWADTATITVTVTGCNGPKTATHIAITTPTVGTPVFALGATSIRCQGSSFQAYTATATTSTSITYALGSGDPNSINTTTGVVVFIAGFSGISVITATANGCNGPATATHTVTVTPTVGTPVFTLGTTSTRCQGAGIVTYAASATNNTGITYSLDLTSRNAGNTINAGTGEVTYVTTWSGSSVITASAAGCNGPKTSSHTVTITPTVSTPVFSMGIQSVRAQGAASITYSATATNSTTIRYSLDAASLAGGNTIDSITGRVTWVAGWFGASAITASATGCNGPSTASHIVNANPSVVQTPLYLSDPGMLLDRIDPVATNIIPTATSYAISSTSAPIAIDASNTVTGITMPMTIAHTTGTGANRLMLVGISQKNRTVIGVTYGSTPLTLVGENNINSNARIALYQLVNPPSGTANVVVNFSSAPDKGAIVNVTTYTGVNQTNPLGTFATQQANSATPSVTVTAATGDLVYDVISIRNQTVNVTAGQTQRWNNASGQEINGAGSTRAGAASTTMSWTASGNADWSIGEVPIQPATSQNSITFTQSPSLCSDLVIKAQTIQMLVYVNLTSGTMPVNPAITASLKYGSTTFISLSNPVYNSSTKILSWTGTLGADVTVPSGQAIALNITSAQAGVQFQIEYHSASKPSRISLLPVSTFIDFVSFNVYNAPYPGGSIRTSGLVNTTYYARAVVTTPFGYKDITGMDVRINPPGNTYGVNCVDSTTCTRTYEYVWTTPGATNMYFLMATAREGYENLIKNSDLLAFDICSVCPPVALNDSATGAGGAPFIVNVLANDYDPNNNMKVSTLAINTQPNNGTGFISNGKVVYLPNGSYAGKDTLVYQICDSTNACATANVYFTVNPLLIDPCSEATKSHVYFMPFSEQEALIALDSSSSIALASNNIRTVISVKIPYPGVTIVWDEWEDGYELNALNPMQATTKVWGDGNPYNGIVPGYASDIIPAGGNIVLDNTIPSKPRLAANIFYDGKDKVTASGQVSITQVCGEPSIIGLQCMKTNVTPTLDYGTSFTIPVGQNFNSQDFRYTSLFIRAAHDSTVVEIDKDNNGSLETTKTLNQGEVFLVNGGVLSGATVTSSSDIGVELHFGGNDNYSSREVPVYPATWYSNTYYSPVPTVGRTTVTPRDSAVVMLYNSLSRPISINWASGVPSSGSVTLPAKSVLRFPLPLSATAAYKFVNPTGESFTAIEIVDSYTPGGGGNTGFEYDWAFNLIAESRLTDYATVAWAPGSTDGSANGNPIWVTPTANTIVYVKYNGNVSGSTGKSSICGMRYDTSYNLNALQHKRIFDPTDNDQSGIAVFTCTGAKLAAVYGEDPNAVGIATPGWDVGSTIQPFCKQKLIFANDDYGRTMINQPVTIPVLLNDFGFLAVVDPATVSTTGLLQPKRGTVTINANGTVIYTPNTGYVGKDTFEYNVCSTPSPVVCDVATVYVDIAVCPAPFNENVIAGSVFLDKNDDGVNNDGGTGVAGAKVYLYVDGNCNTVIDTDELKDSVTVDASGTYQFITYPEKQVEDDFDGTGGVRTCNNGSDGNAAWATDWVDAGDPSTGPGNAAFCVTPVLSLANTDAEIIKDGAFTNAIRLKDNNVSVTRRVNLSGAAYAFLSFSYRRAALVSGHDIIVQASSNGTAFSTIFTIAGTGAADTSYINIYNQDITQYAAAPTYIRFLTNNSVTDADSVFIDNIKIQFIRYPICYITRLDASTVPAYHHTTTILQHAVTATSAQTCLAPFDFGIAKNKLIISGTLFHDANGIVDNLVNGTAIGAITGSTVYAYLVDSTGKVVRKTTLNSSTGAYTFNDADVLTNYTLRLSTLSVNIGDPPPVDAGTSYVAGSWVPTGDAYGINNTAGTGIKAGAATCIISVTTATTDITAVNFGIERLPDSDNKTLTYARNDPNVQYDITGGLTGSDPEDGVLGSGKTYKLTQLPARAVLYYNGFACTLNQVITGFNPALLKIDPDDDARQAIFMFASRDAAGLYDPSPATVTVSWNQVLPVKLISFSGRLNGTKVDLNWVTANELNTKHFEVQRSADGQNFSSLGIVAARGNSSTPTSYDLVDPVPLKGINYYRLKMVDIDGKFEYSQIVIIRIENSIQLVTKVAPNPFTGKIDVYLTLTHNTPVDFRFIDINGRMVFSKSVKGLKGFNWFTINDLDKLPSAPYMLHIKTDDATIVEKLIKQ